MKTKSIAISVLLSIASIVITVLINAKIAARYINADGKTRALFGITEMLSFGYQYYVASIGLVAFLFALFAAPVSRTKKIAIIILSLLAILLVFARIWRLFV